MSLDSRTLQNFIGKGSVILLTVGETASKREKVLLTFSLMDSDDKQLKKGSPDHNW